MRSTMLSRFATLLAAATLVSACTGGDGGSDPDRSADGTGASGTSVRLASLGLDWATSGGTIDPGARPGTPEGFDGATLDRMASTLTDWAAAAAVDPEVWRSKDPLKTVEDVLPDPAAQALRAQVKGAVSPRLAVANVFGDDVTVVGKPQVSTAWKVSTDKDDSGKPFVLLELQTRTAYEVRSGKGPSRVIGVLRVHGLSAYAGASDEFGVSGGWQEFGAADCDLALDDALEPDGDASDAAVDLKTFVSVGNGDRLTMPDLGKDQKVDDEYLKRCRDRTT